jgi:hypothetical protein
MLRLAAVVGLGLAGLAGCGVRVTGGSPADQGTDGGGGGGGGGGDGGVVIDAPAVDAPNPNARVVYLNFDPVTLFQAAASDATKNEAAWLQAGSGSSPGYHTNVGTQQEDIAAVTSGVTNALDGVAKVVTTRPLTGEYVMIVYGGTAADVKSFYGDAVNELDCGDVVPNDVGWIADQVSTADAVNDTLGAIGFGLGLTSTTTTTDCMCSWGNNCTPAAGSCVLDNGIARATSVFDGPNGQPLSCPAAGPTQDELTTFKTAFASGL